VALSGFTAASALAVLITEFPLPAGAEPESITKGSDGNLWFTAKGVNGIGQMNTAGALTGMFTLGLTAEAEPDDIVDGPEGDLWFTERRAGKIGRITPQGSISEFEVPERPLLSGIAAGSDGNLWFTDLSGAFISSISPSTGLVSSYPVFTGVLTSIVAGPGGALWFTNPAAEKIGRITTSGTVEEFGPIPSTSCAVGAPPNCPFVDSIAVGSEGDLWFNEAMGDWIGRITPTGEITEYSAGLSHSAGVNGLALGPEGNMWFVEEAADQVGYITPSGVISEFSAGLSPGSGPVGIALGPDENLWVTEQAGDRIARVIPNVPPILGTGGALAVTRNSAVLTGTVRSRGADTQYYFQYGPTAAYGSSTPSMDNGAGDTSEPVEMALAGLAPGAEYHYRIVASSANGQSFGSDASFRTSAPLPVSTVKRFKITLLAKRGHRRLRISRINVEGVSRGERIAYSCGHCEGKHRKGSRLARASKLSIFTRDLLVTSRSVLTVAVTATNGDGRTRVFAFHPASLTEPFSPRSEACHVPHATEVTCP
jgi:streptogramin lyase